MMGDEPTGLDCSVVDYSHAITPDSLVSGDKPYMMGDEPTELDCSVVDYIHAINP